MESITIKNNYKKTLGIFTQFERTCMEFVLESCMWMETAEGNPQELRENRWDTRNITCGITAGIGIEKSDLF